jgi:hypothetical protein
MRIVSDTLCDTDAGTQKFGELSDGARCELLQDENLDMASEFEDHLAQIKELKSTVRALKRSLQFEEARVARFQASREAALSTRTFQPDSPVNLDGQGQNVTYKDLDDAQKFKLLEEYLAFSHDENVDLHAHIAALELELKAAKHIIRGYQRAEVVGV